MDREIKFIKCLYCGDKEPEENYIVSSITMRKSNKCRKCRLKDKQKWRRERALLKSREFIPRAKWDPEAEQIRCQKVIEKQQRRLEVQNRKRLRKDLPPKQNTILFQFLSTEYPELVNLNSVNIKENHPEVYLHYHRHVSKLRYNNNLVEERNKVRLKKAVNPSMYANKNKRFKRLLNTSDGSITKESLTKLINDATSCPYCGTPLNDLNKSIDHLDPVCKGGIHSLKNILICCKRCNYEKKNKPFFKFITRYGKKRQKMLTKLYESIKKRSRVL